MSRLHSFGFLIAFFSTVVSAAEITPPTYGPSAYNISTRVVATNGRTILSLWTLDMAPQSFADVTPRGGKHIYGSVADMNGAVLTPTSFLVLHDALLLYLFPYDDQYVAVVKDQTGIRSVILSERGEFVRYAGNLPGFGSMLDVGYLRPAAFNGSDFFFILSATSTPPPPTGRIISLDGSTVVDAIPIGPGTSPTAVTTIGRNFFVVTGGQDGVFLWRIQPDGLSRTTRLGAGVPTGYLMHSVSITANGDDLVAAWMVERFSDGGVVTYVAEADQSGRVKNQSQFDADRLYGINAYHDDNGVILVLGARKLIRLGSDLQAVDSLELPVGPVASGNGILFSLTAGNSFPNVGPLYATTITQQPLKPLETTTLSIMKRRQAWPAVATDGVNILTVWSDQLTPRMISAALLAHDGSLVAGPIAIGEAAAPPEQPYFGVSQAASVTFGLNTYLVTYRLGADILARRIDRTGKVLDSEPLIIAKGSYYFPSVTWNGTSFAVLYGTAIRTVAESGVLSDPVPVTVPGLGPTLTWDGTRYLMTWGAPPPCRTSGGCPTSPLAIQMVRLDASFHPIDTTPVGVDWSTTAAFHVVTSGREFVIAADTWNYYSAAPQQTVQLRRVLADGSSIQISDPVSVLNWNNTTLSDLSWDGVHYVVTAKYGLGVNNWITAIRFDRDLNRVGPGSYSSIAASDAIDPPAIVPIRPGETLVIASETETRGEPSRLHAHRESDMQILPAAPPSPLITSAIGNAQAITIAWLMAPVEVSMFAIERTNIYGQFSIPVGFAAADARSAAITTATYSTSPDYLFVQMRAINPAGVSPPTAPVRLTMPQRKRSAGH